MKKKKKVTATRKTRKAAPAKSQELVVRVMPQEVIPTTSELAEPIKDGKNLSIAKTWVTEKQILRMVQKTPKQFIYRRKGRGGKEFDYVTGSYVERVLNFVFGFMWDFEVKEHGLRGDHIWVLGALTVKDGKGNSITKTQFGRKEVAYLKDKAHTEANMVDFGNDLKSATTDALKKCASLFGIASDVYGKGEYKEESGVTPRPAETVVDARTGEERVAEAVQTIKDKHAPESDGEICKGVDGKACTYGNDAEPLTPEVAAYSKKIYGKPLCRECQKDAKKK
jgi:hypothetical protein